MCYYPHVTFSCCTREYQPTTPLPITRLCPQAQAQQPRHAIRPPCPYRLPDPISTATPSPFRFPIMCPGHKLAWLNALDLNDECQRTDMLLRDVGASDAARFRYRDNMGRAFEALVAYTQRLEREKVAAWEARIFYAGFMVELLGCEGQEWEGAEDGHDEKMVQRLELDYGVLERLRGRLVRGIGDMVRGRWLGGFEGNVNGQDGEDEDIEGVEGGDDGGDVLGVLGRQGGGGFAGFDEDGTDIRNSMTARLASWATDAAFFPVPFGKLHGLLHHGPA